MIAQACLYHAYTCLYICVCHVYTFVCVPILVCTIVYACSNSMSRRLESRQEICLSWTLGSLLSLAELPAGKTVGGLVTLPLPETEGTQLASPPRRGAYTPTTVTGTRISKHPSEAQTHPTLHQGQLNEDKLKGRLHTLESQLRTCTQVSTCTPSLRSQVST